MATDRANNTEDIEMEEAEYDGDKVVTMVDVLREQQDFEEDANAVLGASDEKNCTYSKGYIKRQAIYVCMTCCPEAKTDPTKRAGVCLACSLNCHENHDCIELYTKRNFRCDCGNPTFGSNSCQFTPKKNELNSNNVYNHNFSGLYCTCERPYPDPEVTTDDDMIQCIICEDWHHATHLDAVVPANDQYSEMICKGCMDKNEFLHDYASFAINCESVDIDVITVDNEKPAASSCNGDVTENHIVNTECKLKISNDDETETNRKNDEHISEAVELNNVTDNIDEKIVTENILSTANSDKIDESPSTAVSEDGRTQNEGNNISDHEDSKSKIEERPINADDEINKTEEPETNEIDTVIETHEQTETADMNDVKKSGNNIEINLIRNCMKDLTVEHLTEANSDSLFSKTKDESSVKTINEKSDSMGEKPLFETTNTDETGKQKENMEKDNADAVMNAIDELLDGPKDYDDRNKESDTDFEITNNEPISESSVDNKSSVTEDQHKVNGDPSNENKALNATKSTIEPQDDSQNVSEPALDSNNESNTPVSINENKRKLSAEIIEETSKKIKLDINKCVRPKHDKKIFKGATFWPSTFRQTLCTCGECISMYKDLNVLFLIDLEDTVAFYESLGKQNVKAASSQYEQGLEALSSLDRIQQINALTEFNNLRDRLLDYLKTFKDRQEVVKEEDIKAFFADMKPRREPDGVYFCR